MRLPKEKPHRKLRRLLEDYGIRQTDLGEAIDRGEKYINERLAGKLSWTVDDVYNICDFLNKISDEPLLPYESIIDYFPRRGARASQ